MLRNSFLILLFLSLSLTNSHAKDNCASLNKTHQRLPLGIEKIFSKGNDFTFLVSTRNGLLSITPNGEISNFLDLNWQGIDHVNVEIYGNSIFTLKYNQRSINVFSRNQSFLGTISLPEEVAYSVNFLVLPDSRFAMLDNKNDKVYFINSQGKYLKTVDILESSDSELQNLDGVVVGNSLILSENGHNQLLKIDLQTYQVSIFRDFSNLVGWLSDIAYHDGKFYICQAQNIYSFVEGHQETLICTLPEGNNTGLVIVGNFGFVTSNFGNKVYKIDLSTGEWEVFVPELDYPSDIEILQLDQDIPENVVNSLYFPRIMETDGWHTTIGITNPTNESLSVDVTAYNQLGIPLETITFDNIPPNGSIYRKVDNTFHPASNPFTGWSIENIAWLKATSTKQLQGFMEFNTEDSTRRMLTEATIATSNNLYVPHVAEETDYWWTDAGIVNTNDCPLVGYSSNQVFTGIPYLDHAGQQINLDLTSFYGETIEAGKGAGCFTSSSPSIAGIEMFGRKGDFHTAAALTLTSLPSKTLYFTHIATNDFWWTGCAVYNVTDEPATVQVSGYDTDGNLLGTSTVMIAPNTKKVALVQDFITTAPMPAYVIMTSNHNIVGFELFGGNTNEILAGFSVDGNSSNTLYFNHIRVNEEEWTGISMINLGDTSATVTLSAYNETGAIVDQNTISIFPKAKAVDLVENLFGGILSADVSHVKVESTEPLAGFELVGNKAQTHLGGMSAILRVNESEGK